MNTSVLVSRLIALAQLDYDVMCTYEEAMRRIDQDDEMVKVNLTEFRNDHAVHVNLITTLLREMDAEVPPLSPESRDAVTEGVVSPTKARGTPAVMEQLRRNERLINDAYRKIVSDIDFLEYPEMVRNYLKSNANDEAEHLAYMDSLLATTATAAR